MTPIQAFILAESDRDALEEERRQNNWRAGWQACVIYTDDAYEEGFLDGLRHGRRLLRAAVKDVTGDLNEARWGPGGREHFADSRPDDYTGGPVPW